MLMSIEASDYATSVIDPFSVILNTDYELMPTPAVVGTKFPESFYNSGLSGISATVTNTNAKGKMSLWVDTLDLGELIGGSRKDSVFKWSCVVNTVSSLTYSVQPNGANPLPTGISLDVASRILTIDPVPSVTADTTFSFIFRTEWDLESADKIIYFTVKS